MTDLDPSAVRCPRCWAPAGHHCWTTGNRPLAQPHRNRVKAAAEHQGAEELLDRILREADAS